MDQDGCPQVTVIIPAYNELATIREILRRVRAEAGLPDVRVDVRELNEAFDRQCSHKVELW